MHSCCLSYSHVPILKWFWNRYSNNNNNKKSENNLITNETGIKLNFNKCLSLRSIFRWTIFSISFHKIFHFIRSTSHFTHIIIYYIIDCICTFEPTNGAYMRFYFQFHSTDYYTDCRHYNSILQWMQMHFSNAFVRSSHPFCVCAKRVSDIRRAWYHVPHYYGRLFGPRTMILFLQLQFMASNPIAFVPSESGKRKWFHFIKF